MLNLLRTPPELVEFRPRTGDALLFKHRLYHTGAEVRAGIKYVMRSDVMYRREELAVPSHRDLTPAKR